MVAINKTGSPPTPQAPPPHSKVRAYLELFRLPNVFTAAADVMMGFLVTHDAGLAPVGIFALLLASSCLIYTAGMVLNDVFDVAVDRRERPERPIPSGRISLATAQRLGFALLIAGAAAGSLAGVMLGDIRPVVVVWLLSGCVVLYNGLLKSTPLAPPLMGACRALNVLLGMSVSTEPWASWNWLVAAGIGTYIVGVTWFARSEARQSPRWRLALGTIVLLSGMGLLAWLPAWLPVTRLVLHDMANWRLFWVVLTLLVLWRCVRAIIRPDPPLVQAAVKNCIHSLIILNAAVCLAVQGPVWAVIILTLIIPTMLLGLWIYST